MDLKTLCQAYPPFPNLYTSHATAVTSDLYIYAARTFIVALDVHTMAFRRAFTASTDRIQAIAAHDTICYTSGVEPTICAWNLLDGKLLTTYQGHKTEVTVIHSLRNGTVLISGDKSGKVVVQETSGSTQTTFAKIHSEVRTIAPMVYMHRDYVAVGYANGMILVLAIDQGLKLNMQNQIVTGNDPILSLAWQCQTEEEAWPLLASSSQNAKCAMVWCVPEEMRYCEIKLPNPAAKWTEQQKTTLWILLSWSPIRRNHIYVTSYIGGILCYDIKKPNYAKQLSSERLDEKHSRIIFSLLWDRSGRYTFTTSLDKQIIKWDMRTRDCVTQIRTHSGFPFSIDIAPLSPGQVAIGYGDCNIKLWNFSESSSILTSEKAHDFYESTTLWKGLHGQIEQVKWHPKKEGILAYSTEYGHVGIYDVHRGKCQPSKSYHIKGGAPSIAWITSSGTDNLVSCGNDGKLLLHEVVRPSQQAVDLDRLIREANLEWYQTIDAKLNARRCFVAIDDTKQFIALGNTDGVVEVYTTERFAMVYISTFHRQKITSMTWKGGDNSIWLATGCSGGRVAVHNISDIDLSSITALPVPQPTPFRVFERHKKSINDLKWSAHNDKMYLASVSTDNLVFVWDAQQQPDPIACFPRHRGRVLCVTWGVLDKDTLFTGAEDRFIYLWNYKDYPYARGQEKQPLLMDEEKAIFKRATAVNSESVNIESTAGTKRVLNQVANKPRKKQKSSSKVRLMHFTQEYERTSRQDTQQRQCLRVAALLFGGEPTDAIQRISSHLPEHLCDATVKRYIELPQGEEEQSNPLELLFGTKNDVRRLVGLEVDQFEQRQTSQISEVDDTTTQGPDLKLALDIMRSHFFKFDTYLNGPNPCVTDWIALALSPTAGKETWLRMMEAQAKKLCSARQYNLAATCYTACSKIYEAINVYRSASMYREAIVLAKLRLPTSSPMIQDLFVEWAHSLQANEEELAAMCFLQTQLPGSKANAINLLARRDKESSLFYAACLAHMLDDNTVETRIANWKAAVINRQEQKKNTESVPRTSTE
ncbi:Gem-associated protein 5 [Apophysomyces sp. BC1015]|nr:Gem-associated protein 5 [Apophysomyces sp. BC1015]KAG0183252.1 Gem-associated protein 5 [Apophysomyces sp. BC1021]